MTLVSPSQSNPGDEINVDAINGPVNQITTVVNGGLDDDNISGISGSKIANGTLPGAALEDDAVTAAKVDFGGSGSGIWWEEIGRTALGSASNTITISSLPARKYLRIDGYLPGTANTIAPVLTINGASSGYVYRSSINGAADTQSTAQASIPLYAFTGALWHGFVIELFNFPSQEKLMIVSIVTAYASGSGSIADRREIVAKYASTTQVSSIAVTTSASTFASGAEVVARGHD